MSHGDILPSAGSATSVEGWFFTGSSLFTSTTLLLTHSCGEACSISKNGEWWLLALYWGNVLNHNITTKISRLHQLCLRCTQSYIFPPGQEFTWNYGICHQSYHLVVSYHVFSYIMCLVISGKSFRQVVHKRWWSDKQSLRDPCKGCSLLQSHFRNNFIGQLPLLAHVLGKNVSCSRIKHTVSNKFQKVQRSAFGRKKTMQKLKC